MAALEIVESGVLIQLQDLGRYGVAEHGLSQGGAMDLHAYCWANLLLNNAPNATQIEITLGQACFKVLEDCCIALTGADMNATLDGKVLVPWQTYQLTQGQILQFGYAREGLRAYLAIKGGFENQTCFGSASTVQRNHLGGIDGKGGALAVGQCLYAKASSSPYRYQAVPARFIPRYQHEITVSVIESYQADSFTADQKARFYSSGYQLTQHSDRMGCRLTGAKIIPQHAGLISQPIAKGAIQVPPDGEPIVLLNDRQTLGGYPIIGCIIQHDLSLVSQLKPGDTIRFACLTPQQFELEQQKWFTFCRFFNVFQT